MGYVNNVRGQRNIEKGRRLVRASRGDATVVREIPHRMACAASNGIDSCGITTIVKMRKDGGEGPFPQQKNIAQQ